MNNEQKLLNLFKKKPVLSFQMAADKLKISYIQARSAFYELNSKKKITMVVTGCYKLVTKTKKPLRCQKCKSPQAYIQKIGNARYVICPQCSPEQRTPLKNYFKD